MAWQAGWKDVAVKAGFIVAGAAAIVAVFDAAWLVFVHDHHVPDFRVYYTAAEDVLRGDSPYPAPSASALTGSSYVYPPLFAILVAPLTALPLFVAEGVIVVAGALVIVATLLLLDVRDWRCYTVSFLWIPVLNAIGLGNLSIFLVPAAALVWRYRNRTGGAVALGTSLAAKLFLWPLLAWFVATRRVNEALRAAAIAAALLLVSWAVIGFAGLLDYPALLRVAYSFWADDSYSIYAIALDLGAAEPLAGLIGNVAAVLVLVAVVVYGRHGNDRAAFILAVAAALAFSPIVWRHYFALLLVPVAIARPRLGLLWFLPLLMWPVSVGIGNGTTFQTSATLAIAATTIGLALWSVRDAPGRVTAPAEGAFAARPL